ncbi:MAG: hypothetical protein COV52_09720 [Gammaproteobacteria bacterium CG11_big_fil_rev_8_21_14_0_20_46_22]|nr:MAG: hypothetical protein COV52_09720 [Gammaproteobacteria bacterium CG11_big_fil_rev_8_21_14_0_20_46_22]
MKQSFYLQAIVNVDDNGLFVNVDLEKTNEAMNNLLIHVQDDGFVVESVTPITSGVGQFQCGPIEQKGTHLTKWLKPSVGSYSYGFGYSYTSGFMILASKKSRKSRVNKKEDNE